MACRPSGGADQSGSVSDGSPQLWTITVGGGNATAGPVKGVGAKKGVWRGIARAFKSWKGWKGLKVLQFWKK